MFEAFVVMYIGLERIKIEDDLGPWKSRSHCEIRTEQILREDVYPYLEGINPAIPRQVKTFCFEQYEQDEEPDRHAAPNT